MRRNKPVAVQRYDFSQPKDLPFTGREDICKDVEEKLSAGRSILLCGIRQVGKTSIVKQVKKSLKSRKGYVCVEVTMEDVYDCGTPYVEMFAFLVLNEISEECKKAGVNAAAQKWTPQFVRKVVKQVHKKLGVRIILFVEELVKYRTWKDSDGTAFLNMLEAFVENGDEIGISLCLISQLSMEMIRQKTPGNCGGLWSRLSNNQVFVPPFQKEELALFCNHSSIPSQSAIEELYNRTSGYADLVFPVIHACDKLPGERRDGLVLHVLGEEELRLRLREDIRETCDVYQEFDLYRVEQVSESLRSDYQKMGLIDADGKFVFSEWVSYMGTSCVHSVDGNQSQDLKSCIIIDIDRRCVELPGQPDNPINFDGVLFLLVALTFNGFGSNAAPKQWKERIRKISNASETISDQRFSWCRVNMHSLDIYDKLRDIRNGFAEKLVVPAGCECRVVPKSSRGKGTNKRNEPANWDSFFRVEWSLGNEKTEKFPSDKFPNGLAALFQP
jgi:energy-coupling factor transporter ATP-binding protein EcfA2